MEKAACVWNLDSRSNKRIETKNYSENRLGKSVSFQAFVFNINTQNYVNFKIYVRCKNIENPFLTNHLLNVDSL